MTPSARSGAPMWGAESPGTAVRPCPHIPASAGHGSSLGLPYISLRAAAWPSLLG